jgi:Na+:H+ antiporter, NhaA family
MEPAEKPAQTNPAVVTLCPLHGGSDWSECAVNSLEGCPPDMQEEVLATARPRPLSMLRAFLDNSASGGLVLMAAAGLALVVANSPLASAYFAGLHAYLGPLSVQHWINDALMAIFFLLVGLEIKREVLDGQLSTWSRRILPGIAATGGMIVPVLIFLGFNWDDPKTVRGWAIPAATDIAFALGVVALLGSRVPTSLKVFLTALAIIDDLGAVAIIAVFYTADLNVAALGGAAILLALLGGMNRLGYVRLTPYLALGAILWFLVLRSGVHATVAGVLLAFTIPLWASPGRPDDMTNSPLHRLEHACMAGSPSPSSRSSVWRMRASRLPASPPTSSLTTSRSAWRSAC